MFLNDKAGYEFPYIRKELRLGAFKCLRIAYGLRHHSEHQHTGQVPLPLLAVSITQH
jgi:hypothetical protein